MRRQKGFTLIELLIVVAIIGIIAAIAIPNLLNAINRGRQKRSMSDMRTIGTAVEAYAVDNSQYVDPFTEQQISSGADFVTHLQPTYVKNVPINDGWRQAFWAKSNSREYSIMSTGRDKIQEQGITSTTFANRTTQHMDCDIVYSNGSFISFPEGTQND